MSGQSLSPESPSKGYVNESEALACAARLLARRQGVELSDADVAKLLARNSLLEGGKCHIGTPYEVRLMEEWAFNVCMLKHWCLSRNRLGRHHRHDHDDEVSVLRCWRSVLTVKTARNKPSKTGT